MDLIELHSQCGVGWRIWNTAIRSDSANKFSVCWLLPGAEIGTRHWVVRGGSWNNNGNNCRSANRNNNDPGNRNNNIGFRVVVAASTLDCQNRRKGFRLARSKRVQFAHPAMRVTASKNQTEPRRSVT
ncbi:MAG: SUMF1/EgtB/PvdO family nonheme iron enzyme [Acidobacteria bacterium]|nr:SUMF1/EgtB/PvdO family nonheme iron enzyme [Acidobacteriota bacterium]